MKEYSEEGSKQTRLRIRLALAAYAYEIENDPIISDAEYDKLALEVNLDIPTHRPDLDKWFKENFNPSTGIWIYNHPELKKIEYLLHTNFRPKKDLGDA